MAAAIKAKQQSNPDEAPPGLSWEADSCAFYRSSADLIEIIVPYFAAGLAANEMCIWVTSDLFALEQAGRALETVIPDLGSRVTTGQISIIRESDLYFEPETANADDIASQWREEYDRARSLGFDGIRIAHDVPFAAVAGNPAGPPSQRQRPGRAGDGRDLKILTTYPLEQYDPGEVLDIAAGHEMALVRSGGIWEPMVCRRKRHASTAGAAAAGPEMRPDPEPGDLPAAAFLSAGFGISIIRESDGVFLEVNDACCEILGCSREEIIGRTAAALRIKLHGADRSSLLEELRLSGGLNDREFRIRRKDGSMALVLTSMSAVRFNGEQCVMISAADLTERRKTERRLIRSNERQEILSESARLLLSSDRPESIVKMICERVMKYLDCHTFFNFLITGDPGRMRLNAYTGISASTAHEIRYLEPGKSVCGCVARDGARIVAEDILNTPDERTELVKTFGIQAYCSHPLIYKGHIIGTLSFGTRSRTSFSDDEIDLMYAVSNMVATAMARKQQEERLRQKDDQIRKAYTDVIAAVTGGKLVLMTGEEITHEYGEPVLRPVSISSAAELSHARKVLTQALMTEYPQQEKLLKRAMLPFSEAVTNAVKHGGGGSFELRRLEEHAQLIIRDSGPGIDFANLPHATLMPGFSTCGTLGMGFKIMLNESSRMLLSTRPGETCVVMEMSV